MNIQQKVISLIVSTNGMSASDLAKELNVSRQEIYSAIRALRKKEIKVICLRKGKYYIEKNTKCDNIFCLHNVINTHKLAQWNETNCGMYEIDPFYEGNKDGFNIAQCHALARYKKFGW